MATYEIGKRIKKDREECKMTQEELAFGICSPGTLSKIENGVQAPNKKTFEALMQRLGEPEYLYSIHLSREEIREMQLYRKIERCFLKEDLVKAEELLDQYQKTFVGARGLDWQRYQALWALWHAKKGASARIVIQELEAALRITMKGYQSGLPDGNKRLTFEEIAIFNNIAVQYYRMGDRKRSFSYITWLKAYFDQYKLDEEEQAQIYPLILGNYADMLCMQGKLKEAKREAERAIWLCKEYAKAAYLAYLLGCLARILTELGEREEAENYFAQAACIFRIMGSYGALEHMRESDRKELSMLI